MSVFKQKAISGVFWNFIEQAFLMLFRTLINIFIARQLFPSDYGLIAVVLIFLHITEVLVNGGMRDALIRKPELYPDDLSTVFLFNLLSSLLLYVVFYYTAPFIATFYNIPDFVIVSRVLGLVIIVNAISMVQNALINRNVNFKFLAKVNITATFIGGITGLVAAYNGFGVWSLVIQSLLKASLVSIIFWTNSSWLPKWHFSMFAFKENFGFGYKLVLSGLINAVFNNLYQLVIGKVYSSESLGNYSQGKRLGEMSSHIFYALFQRTSYPLLSSIQNENEHFNSVYLKLIRVLSFISFPVAFLMLLIGEPLIILLLTDKWINAIPFFYILCFSGMFFPITGISAYACLAKGRSDLFLRYEILYKVLMVALIGFTYRYDIRVMVTGQAFLLFFQFVVNFIVTGRVIGLKLREQVYSTLPAFALSLVVMIITYSITFFDLAVSLELIFQTIIFATLYIVFSYYFNIRELAAIKEILNEKLFRRK